MPLRAGRRLKFNDRASQPEIREHSVRKREATFEQAGDVGLSDAERRGRVPLRAVLLDEPLERLRRRSPMTATPEPLMWQQYSCLTKLRVYF